MPQTEYEQFVEYLIQMGGWQQTYRQVDFSAKEGVAWKGAREGFSNTLPLFGARGSWHYLFLAAIAREREECAKLVEEYGKDAAKEIRKRPDPLKTIDERWNPFTPFESEE